MAQVSVKFLTHASKDSPPYVDASPGDEKKIDAEYVPAGRDVIFTVVSKAEAKKAGVE